MQHHRHWQIPPLRKDYLAIYDHLAVWARQVEFVNPDDAQRLRAEADLHPTQASDVLTRTAVFRDALYSAVLNPGPNQAWQAVAAEIHAAAAAARLTPGSPHGAWTLSRRDVGLALPLLAAARTAGELLTSPQLARVRACPGQRCGMAVPRPPLAAVAGAAWPSAETAPRSTDSPNATRPDKRQLPVRPRRTARNAAFAQSTTGRQDPGAERVGP